MINCSLFKLSGNANPVPIFENIFCGIITVFVNRQGSDAGVHRHTTLDTMMDGNAPGDPLSNTNPNIIVMKELCDQRVDLMNELSELNAFFEMRLFELNSTEEELAFSSTDFIREAKKKFPVLAIGLTDVKRLKHTVSEIIDSLYDKRLVRICAMGADPDGLKRYSIYQFVGMKNVFMKRDRILVCRSYPAVS